MGSHELNDLQSAFCTIDVRDLDIGFLFFLERRGLRKQSIGQNRRRRRIWIAPETERGPLAVCSVLASGSGGSSSREFTASATR
jgi:hypothetical protein